MCHCAAAGWWSGSPGCPDCLAVVTFSFPARMSGRRTLFLDQRCTSVVYCSTCLYRPRAHIMRLHSFVFGLVVVAVSAAFLWVISPYAGARSEERRVGKVCVRTCRSRGSPLH